MSVTGLSSRAVSPNIILTPQRIASPGLQQNLTPEALLPSWNKWGSHDAFQHETNSDLHLRGYASDKTGARKKSSYGRGGVPLLCEEDF